MAAPDAIILVDHGSRFDAANAMLNDVAALLARMTPLPIYPAHMELAKPSIAQAFHAAVAKGARFVFVFPYFLSPGRHSQKDIPELVRAAAAEHPGTAWHVCGPIGVESVLCELIVRRVQNCAECNFSPQQCSQCPAENPTGRGA